MNQNKALTKAALRQMYVNEGLSTVEISTNTGASTAGVTAALHRFGIGLRSRRDAARIRHRHTWEADWCSLAKRYEDGATLEDLACEVECTPGVASRHLAEFTTIRPRGCEVKPNSRGRIEIDIDRAIAMNQNGATLTEIGAKLGNVSVQVVSKRFREAGHSVLRNRATRSKFMNVQVKKRIVAQAINATCCVVCKETRGVQLCHIQAQRKGGELNPDNAVALCPNHHWFFDRGCLRKPELRRLRPYLVEAAHKGYAHHHYGVEPT